MGAWSGACRICSASNWLLAGLKLPWQLVMNLSLRSCSRHGMSASPITVGQVLEAGKLRSIAQFGATRAAALITVPTLKEQGIDYHAVVDAQRAIYARVVPKLALGNR